MIHKFTLLETLLLRLDVIPHPLLDALTHVVLGRALQVGTKIGLFEVLEKQPQTLEELSTKIGFSQEGLEPVIDCLCALGYLKLENAKYCLTKRGHKFFTEKSKFSMKNTILFSDYVFEALGDLEENVKRGKPKNVNLDMFTARQWDIFNKTMIEVAGSNAEEIAMVLPKKSNFKSLLDIGGSHGLHAIAYCRKIPGMKANILDLAPVEAYAKKVIKENKMESRVRFQVGDFLKNELKGKYDVIFAFNIIHGLRPNINEKLTREVYTALNPGGMYVILDQIKDATGGSDLSRVVSAAQGLMLFNQAGGKTYSYLEVRGWLEEVGFSKVKMKKLRAPGNALIIGFK